jgi:SH3-like domain-containing protein
MGRVSLCLVLLLGVSGPSIAQQIDNQSTTRTINRVVEPVDYWVDTAKLRVRDDPFAGDALGWLEWGKKVSVYEQIDNWMRVTPAGKPAQWINGDFVSDTRLTWSTYNLDARRKSNQAVTDIDLTRVKYDGDKAARVFAFNKKALGPKTRMVDTRHNLADGSYYERYLVQCSGLGTASHLRLLGEGYSYIAMYEDPRNLKRMEDLDESNAINSDIPESRQAIAKFACGKKS